jgi:hypothetical protein
VIAEQCARGQSSAELLDYWLGDVEQEKAEAIEAHVFECAECAARLADMAELATAVADAVRGSRIHSVITHTVLNRLSRDGVHIRTYTPEAGRIMPCAVWPEDDLIVTKLKGDFTGYDRLTLVLTADAVGELNRDPDIPLVSGGHEILTAVSAAQLRQLPSMRLRIIVSGTRGDREQVVAEYGLAHAGAVGR